MVCFVQFDLEMCFDVLRATTAFTFSTFQKCLLRAWCVLHNSVHFFDISTSKSSPKVRCFPPQLCVRVLVFDSVSRASSASASITSHHMALCVAGVALGDIDVRFTWQAWHNLTSTFVLRGRRGTYGTGWRAWAGFRRRTLRGRRGTWWHLRAFHVAGVAQSHIHLRFAWQAWHSWHWVARSGPLGRAWRRGTLRGRRGTWWHPPWFHVAGMALGDIHLRFAWQAWPLWHWAGCGVTRHLCHTPSFTHSVTHHLSHTIFDTPSFKTLSHTIFVTQHLSHTLFHTQLCHTPSLTHHLSHTTLSPTIFVTPSFTHNFVTLHLSHTALSHTIFDTPSFTHHLCHTHTIFHTLSHTIFQLCHTLSFTHNFVTHYLSHTTLSHTTLSHAIFHTASLTHHLSHHFVTHHLSHPTFVPHHFVTHHSSHTTLSHTIFHHTIFHTQLCRTPSFTTPSFTHNFVAHHLPPHHLSHTTLLHTIFHTQLCHPPSLTHHLSHTTLSHTTLSHTHTICLCHTPSFTYNFVTHNFVLLLGPPPPPLSFLIGRSCLVGLSGPLISILTWKCASRHNGVQFFISHLARWLRTRCFSEPTFRPSGATDHWKNTVVSRLCYLFAHLHLLSSDSSSLILFLLLSLFSDSSHLCFSSVHIVGSLTSKLPADI